MTKYLVTGGTRLKGTVRVHGAKNAGFKAMIAALLGDSPSQIQNYSQVGDIDTTWEIIECLGARVTSLGDHSLEVDPSGLSSFDAPTSCGVKSRAGMMFAGPLLAKFGRAVLPSPGGDKIGARPIDRHLAGLEALGVNIKFMDGVFRLQAPKGLTGGRYRFEKNTHTGTETLIMAAVKASGRTILENAASEPEVDNLIAFLNAAGGRIKRVDPRTIVIDGVSRLSGANHMIIADRNAVVTFACAALATRGDVLITGADKNTLAAFLAKVEEIGGGVEAGPQYVRFFSKKKLVASNVVTAPHPGFMTDWQPIWTTLMAQAKGVSTVHETVYEDRFGHVPVLIEMGAKIELFEPPAAETGDIYNFNIDGELVQGKHAIKIFGPALLVGREVTVSDIRMGATILLAGMVASGETVIIDPQDQIRRGYEKLDENLASLGAKVEAVSEGDDSVIYSYKRKVWPSS